MSIKYDKLKEKLVEKRDRLVDELDGLKANSEVSVGYGNHMADDASEAFEQAKDMALRQNAEQLLAKVTDALERFEEGTYGVCEQCGADIDPARLKALPYATLCLRCQQRLNP